MIFFGLIFGLWFLLKTPILFVCFYASYYIFRVYEYLPWLMTDTEFNTLRGAIAAIPAIKPPEHGFKSLIMLAEIHGYILRWFAIPFMLWIGWRTKKGIVRFRYRRHIRNVYDLIEIQAKHFPASAIIRGKNILSMHPYKGPWATYTLPLDFALDNQILWASRERVSDDDKLNKSAMFPIPAFTPDQKLLHFREKREMLPSYRYVIFDYEQANAVFAKQLGELWRGHAKLPPLEKALYAAFCAQACGDQGVAWKMVEQLAFSFKEGKRDANGKLITPHHANIKGTDELLEKYANRPAIVDIQNRHAHIVNVMFSTLALARRKGRLTHANFLWLKPVNRTLWYALCGQGGQVPFYEAAGPWAHLLVEEHAGRKLNRPMVAGAVHALKDTMSREHWIDPCEYSEEHQRKLVAEANELLKAAGNKAGGGAKNRGHMGGSSVADAFRTPAGANRQHQKRGYEDEEP